MEKRSNPPSEWSLHFWEEAHKRFFDLFTIRETKKKMGEDWTVLILVGVVNENIIFRKQGRHSPVDLPEELSSHTCSLKANPLSNSVPYDWKSLKSSEASVILIII